jgi:hypothetical protein
MATEYLEKALIMTHPQSGLLALRNELCLQLRLTTLSNIACCMCLSGKPNFGLKYAYSALTVLRQSPHAASGDAEVCKTTMPNQWFAASFEHHRSLHSRLCKVCVVLRLFVMMLSSLAQSKASGGRLTQSCKADQPIVSQLGLSLTLKPCLNPLT